MCRFSDIHAAAFDSVIGFLGVAGDAAAVHIEYTLDNHAVAGLVLGMSDLAAALAVSEGEGTAVADIDGIATATVMTSCPFAPVMT